MQNYNMEDDRQDSMSDSSSVNNRIERDRTGTGHGSAADKSRRAATVTGSSTLRNKTGRKDSQVGQMIRFVVILVLVAGVIIAVYLRMTNRSKNSAKYAEENMTEVEILKLYDLEGKYPKAARDVVKLHCRMLKCAYNEKLSDDDYATLNAQMRRLFSQDLLAQNDADVQLEELKSTTKEFRTDGKIYISYTVDQESNIQYSTVDGVEYALVLMSCNIKQSAGTNTLNQEYLLCKEDGEWKIVGWQGIVVHTIEEQK